MTTRAGGEPFDWDVLVPRLVHPLKVAIIEATHWIGEPLSASQLAQCFGERWSLSLVSYHQTQLAKLGVLVEDEARRRRVRGSVEKLYGFNPSP